MATTGRDAPGRTSSEFVDETVLEAFVPIDSQTNLSELLDAWDGEGSEDKNTVVPFVEQRQFLLLDEQVPVFVVLRTKRLEQHLLQTYLARLVISLEARAYGTLHVKPGDTEKPLPANELLFSGPIPQEEEPVICATEVQRKGEEGATRYVYIVWKLLVQIARPKSKINKLAIYFTPFASLKPVESAVPQASDDEYMLSGVPESHNLLAPFANDPALKGARPKLLASRVGRAPSSPAVKEFQRPLRSGSRRLFRAAPAFLWRLHSIDSPAVSDRNAMIAALDLEITPFAGSDMVIETVDLSLSTGTVEPMDSYLPIRSHPGDQITFLFKLLPDGHHAPSSPNNMPNLTIRAGGTVLMSASCEPKIQFTWSTPIELPSSRPTSRVGPKESPKPLGPDSLPMLDQYSSLDTTVTTYGLIISITGAPTVAVGETFAWEVFVVNRTDKVHRLAMIALTKRRPWSKHGHKDSSSSIRERSPVDSKPDLAEAVVDERVVFTTQRNALQEPADLICLSPDVRIGPLAPSACFVAELRFVALTAGVLNLDALRVVDLSTQETMDITDLPDIVVKGSNVDGEQGV